MPSDDHAERFQLETFLPYRLVIMTDGIRRTFGELYAMKFNVTISEWRLLAVVAESSTLSPSAAGIRTAMDKVRVSRASQSLAAKGLLRQTKDPRDGRGRLLRLTRKGMSTYSAIVPRAIGLEAGCSQTSAGPSVQCSIAYSLRSRPRSKPSPRTRRVISVCLKGRFTPEAQVTLKRSHSEALRGTNMR